MNESHNTKCSGVNIGLKGIYRAQCIDPLTQEILSDTGWNKNLILNGGMDGPASAFIANLNSVGVAGTGSRPNSIGSVTSTITQSGALVYLYERTGLPDFTSSYSTYTSSVNIGDVLRYSNGNEVTVTAVTDAFNLQVTPSYTINQASSQSFTVWKTSQIGLEKEIKRSGTYLQGVGNCGTSNLSGSNKVIHLRTIDFAAETSLKDYTEVGVSWTGTVNGPVFSRILLPFTMSVNTGKQLRLIHQLYVEYTPTSSVYFTASISGWPVLPATTLIATQSIQNFSGSNANQRFLFSWLSTDGTSYNGQYMAALDPFFTSAGAGIITGFISTNSSSLSGFSTAINRTDGGASLANVGLDTGAIVPYIPGSYTVYKRFRYDVNSANYTNIQSMGYGYSYGGSGAAGYDSTNQAFTVVFREPQTKTSLQTMEITWKYSWTRVIA